MRTALPLIVLVSVAPVARAQDIAAVDGKPGTDIVSVGVIGDVHIVAEPTLASGRLVLHIAAVNRGKAVAPFGPGDVSIATANDGPVAIIPRDTLLAEAAASKSGPSSTTASSGYAAPALTTNGAGQLDTTGYTGTMGMASGGVPQDTLDRNRAVLPKPNIAALDSVLLKQVDVRPNGVEGGQVVSERLKLRGDRVVVITAMFAGERHVVRLPAPRK